MKTKVVMPPPGEFSRADKFSGRRWRRIQHIDNELGQRWRKEFLSTLQFPQKWNKIGRETVIDDIVLLKVVASHNQWPMATVVHVHKDSEDAFRIV